MSNIDELLIEALDAEKKAKEFYLNASNQAQTAMGTQFFKELADFEQNHYHRVQKIIESRKEGISIEGQESTDIPMIKPEIQGQVEPNKDEIVDVINKAIQAEKEAQERYRQIAEMIDSSEGKDIFNSLAEDESKHQRLLEDQFYHMSNKGTIIWGE